MSRLGPNGRSHDDDGLAWSGAALGELAAPRYRSRRDLQRDSERLTRFEPSILETLCRVEHAQAGEGPRVLVVHGVFGAYDFGVGPGRVKPPGYRIVAPSRLAVTGRSFTGSSG